MLFTPGIWRKLYIDRYKVIAKLAASDKIHFHYDEE